MNGSARWGFWVFIAVLVVLHFVLRIGLGFAQLAPDLLLVALLLAAREMRAGSAPPAKGSKSMGAKGFGLWCRFAPPYWLDAACSLMPPRYSCAEAEIEHPFSSPGPRFGSPRRTRELRAKRPEPWVRVLTSRNGLGRVARTFAANPSGRGL